MTDKQVFNEKELAKELGLSSWTVRRMRLQENCPHFKIGARIFYRLETVLRWIGEKENGVQKLEPTYGGIRRVE